MISNSILSIKLFSQWQIKIWNLLEEYIPQEVITEIKDNPPDILYSEDLSWIDDKIQKYDKECNDIRLFLSEKIRKNYKFIEAFHATNTNNNSSFYKHGLLPFKKQEMSKKAFKILREKINNVTDKQILDAIKEISTEECDGRVFFELDDSNLINRGGHYLLYGSEFVIAAAANLLKRNSPDYRVLLRNIGKPTIFICKIPITLIPYNTIMELAGNIISILFDFLINPEIIFYPERFGFSISKPLLPRYILSHYHPNKIRDPSTQEIITIE